MPSLSFSLILDLRRELKRTNAEVLTWGCDNYDDRIKQWSDLRDVYTGAVVRVSSSEDVTVVVGFATNHRIPLAVKGGGYSTSGASTTQGGILLDLSNLRTVRVEGVSNIIIAAGGALWDDIDVAAAQYHLAVVGTTLNRIGVAGATLGGGYGWLTGQYGLAIDNLLWAKMVLADGSQVITSQDQNPDLFWAIRGAGQSFGVAVELAFRGHTQNHPVFAGTLRFSAERLPDIVTFANRFEALTDGRQGFWFGFTLRPSTNICDILVVIFHNGDQFAAEQFFSPLFSCQPIFNNAQLLPYDSLNSILNAGDTCFRRSDLSSVNATYQTERNFGARKCLGGSNVALPLDPKLIESIFRQFDELLRVYPQARDSGLFFEFIPNVQVRKIANDATSFASRGPYYNVSSLFRWHGMDLDQKMQSAQRDLMERIGNEAGIASKPDYNTFSKGTGLYANYALHNTPLQAVFGANIPRLRELKMKYDPHNTFRRWHGLVV
ncbi:hypothetical protein N7492_006379 [Penicillium capsulatum]|uniref:FAD-binding PCMH-type domain-containing protein n=1 Tax=Penicillium capsulatum TaxID=69766 RepID=A0A9W9I3F4_9EURO|nr:hypothetical protein N7492_006379 [Penicillium capsulatum]KAJ6109027.1 hypothetical protein N7512_008864 [Penicillium capsulatum]